MSNALNKSSRNTTEMEARRGPQRLASNLKIIMEKDVGCCPAVGGREPCCKEVLHMEEKRKAWRECNSNEDYGRLRKFFEREKMEIELKEEDLNVQ